MIKRILSLSLVLFFCACQKVSSHPSEVCFKEKCFSVELAVSEQEHFKGLQGREKLAKDSGMLFAFSYPAAHSFWMKDTLIPLDMIWLDHARRVVYIASEVPPCKHDPCDSYTPDQMALYVLEINAGQAKRLGIKIGDVAEFNLNN